MKKKLNNLKNFLFLLFLAIFAFVPFNLKAKDASPDFAIFNAKDAASFIREVRNLESINAVQLKLSNGMTLCLRPSGVDSDEVFFKLSALGGYASLDEKNFFSGELADEIAWESGFGGMTSDQVSVFLYENSLEFILGISPFSRSIEAEGQKGSMEAFFQCVNQVFTRRQFTEEGYKTAKLLMKEIISKLNHDNEHIYETTFLKINTQDFKPLRPMKIEDLDQVNFEEAKKFFERCFSDPSDFFCVITGNFDVKEVKKFIEEYIGTIPKPKTGSRLIKTFSVPFPPGITEVNFHLKNQTSCLTHVTFPLQVKVSESNIDDIAFMCQIIEARLRRAIIDKMNLSYGVDVSYEFPVYPFLNNPWVSIRYRCENKIIGSLKEIVISELKHLQAQGVTLEEVETIKKLEKGSNEFWLKDDFYWVSMLSNHYLWGWNPEKIDYKNTSINKISIEEVNRILKEAISLSNFSVVSAAS